MSDSVEWPSAADMLQDWRENQHGIRVLLNGYAEAYARVLAALERNDADAFAREWERLGTLPDHLNLGNLSKPLLDPDCDWVSKRYP